MNLFMANAHGTKRVLHGSVLAVHERARMSLHDRPYSCKALIAAGKIGNSDFCRSCSSQQVSAVQARHACGTAHPHVPCYTSRTGTAYHAFAYVTSG